MKLEEIVNVYYAIAGNKNIIGTDYLLKYELPITISIRLCRIVELLKKDIEIYETKRFELIKKYGTETIPNSNQWQVLPEKIVLYANEINDLLAIEIEINNIDNYKLNIKNLEDLKIKGELILKILKFINDESRDKGKN